MKKLIISCSMTLVALAFVGGALADSTPSPSASPTPRAKKTVDVACVSSAIDKRDNAVITARDGQHDGITSAIRTRITALKSAWGYSDAKSRNTALRLAWQDYQKAARAANKSYSTAQNAAWTQFRNDIKSCGPGANADSVGSGVDAQ